jgi:Ca-activated chloride channel family protein
MKTSSVALLSLAGMLVSSVAVYSTSWIGPGKSGDAPATSPQSAPESAGLAPPESAPGDTINAARFSAGSRLLIDGRVGHARIAQGTPSETFVLLEVRSAEGAAENASAPSNLALVIDRSGSMKGNRLKNAIRAAKGALDSLKDGDVVSVVAFDTRPTIVVPSTVVGPDSRERVRSAIEAINLGGDTCISCGVEEGARQIQQTAGKVNRMIVLSDGDATDGVRDVPGFQRLAEQTRDRGVSVTTIGVDLAYNQKILATLAQGSGGRHYFVEDEAALARAFASEAERLKATVASDAEASVELGEGVELAQVFDRSFRKEGRRIVVPLGTFAPGDIKTVLLRVRVPAKTGERATIADVSLRYRDLREGKDERATGSLGVVLAESATGASAIDGDVQKRLARGETAAALLLANDLFEQGKPDEARRVIEEHKKSLEVQAESASKSTDAPKRAELEKDFKGQYADLDSASAGYGAGKAKAAGGAKPSDTPEGRRAVRVIQEAANPYKE